MDGGDWKMKVCRSIFIINQCIIIIINNIYLVFRGIFI